jgi:RNA polymerase sigma-70 factor (ECF subfamily)
MELLERFAQGDMNAFEELFRQFQRDVYGWIVRIVRDTGTAEDLTVDTFLRAYRAHARFDPAGNFPGWARRIATNLALDHLRKTRREVPLVEDIADAPQPNPVVQRETHERIALAFRRLSPKLRVVATLALVEDVPHREIAEALGISEAAVRVRAFRAARILREQLKELMPDYERAK